MKIYFFVEFFHTLVAYPNDNSFFLKYHISGNPKRMISGGGSSNQANASFQSTWKNEYINNNCFQNTAQGQEFFLVY